MKFEFMPTEFEGLNKIRFKKFSDNRGELIKYFQSDIFPQNEGKIDDIYTTISNAHVVRGMHHQIAEFGQIKVISCLTGCFWDIAVDLRKKSKTYGKIFTYLLDSRMCESLYIPAGFSHGTYSMADSTTMLSLCIGKYLPEYESGVKMESLNLDFFDSKYANVSEKDKNLKNLQEYLNEL